MKIRVVVALISLLFVPHLRAVVKGSETAVSVEEAATFPAADNDNTMLGFGWFKNGFILEDLLTTCSFNDVFPVSGTINLNGGTLRLQQDLLFRNVTTLQGLGRVIGNGHELRLCQSINEFPSNSELFEDVHIFCDSNIDFATTITFRGNCTICGNGNFFKLEESDAAIIVDTNSSVVFRNIQLCCMKDTNIRCVDDTGSIVLDDVSWEQEDSFTWGNGSIEFKDRVDLNGSSTFIYSSLCTSTIAECAQLAINNGMSFSLGRDSEILREPLVFDKWSSSLKLNNCSLIITGSGVQFTKGELITEHTVTIDVVGTSTDTGFILGDNNVANDITISILPCSAIIHNSGYLVFNNVSPDGLVSTLQAARLFRGINSLVYANNNLNIHTISVELVSDLVAPIGLASGKLISYSSALIVLPEVEYEVSCDQAQANFYLLNGNRSVFLTKGTLPINLTVSGSGNQLLGTGGISGAVTLSDSDSYLTTYLNGFIDNTIALNNGTLTLAYDLLVPKDGEIVGPGIVNLASNDLCYCKGQPAANTPIFWQGSDGAILFGGNISLSSTWTFNGQVTIDGRGNELILSDDAALVIDQGSDLTLKNIVISGVQDNNIRCLNDDGIIRFVNTNMVLDGDYTFTTGAMDFMLDNSFSGTHLFTYDSVYSSTIHQNSKLKFKNGSTFSIDRPDVDSSIEPLEFDNKTAILHIDDSTLSIGDQGMQVTKGTIRISRDSTIDINSTSTVNGLMLGNGQSSGDVFIEIDPAAVLNLSTGHLIYNVTDASGFISKAKPSRIIQGDSYSTHFMKSILFSGATIQTTLASFTTDSGVSVSISNVALESSVGNYRITGSRPSAYTIALSGGGDSFYVDSGVAPFPISASGTNNTIGGAGDIAGTITLQDSSAALTLQLLGLLTSDAVMNDGTLTLANDLYLGSGVMFTGNGTINLSDYSLYFGSETKSWSDNTYWSGSGGAMHFNSNISLSGTWTFGGNVVVHGNDQTFDLGATGNIFVDSNSSVMFHGLRLENVSDENIQCVDDTSVIMLDDVAWCQSDSSSYNFDTGALRFTHKVLMCGNDSLFVYSTSETSTICSESKLVLDTGFTFSYDPGVASKNLLAFEDESSKLTLKSSTLHSTATGMQLKKGGLEAKGESYLSSDKAIVQANVPRILDEGIMFGSGTAADDFSCVIVGGASLTLSGGTLVYNNTVSNLLVIENTMSNLHIDALARLVLDQSMQVATGGIEFGNHATFTIKNGKTFTGSIFPLGYLHRGSKQ